MGLKTLNVEEEVFHFLQLISKFLLWILTLIIYVSDLPVSLLKLGHFRISLETGWVSVNHSLDRETVEQYRLRVRASNSVGTRRRRRRRNSKLYWRFQCYKLNRKILNGIQYRSQDMFPNFPANFLTV